MIFCISGEDIEEYKEIMDKAYMLRHSVFVDGKGWKEIEKPNKHDVDDFDHTETYNILYIYGNEVKGYARLTPMSAPNLLADLHSHLVADNSDLRSPTHLEWTRYCVDEAWTSENPKHLVGARLIAAMFELGFENGFSFIFGEGNPNWVPKLQRLGLKISPIGLPHFFDDEPTIAMKMEINENSVRRTKLAARIRGQVFSNDFAQALAAAG